MQLSDLRGPVLSALRWTAISRVVMQIVTWSATLLAVRLLTPADYGIVTIATLLSGYLALLSEVGLSAAIVQRRITDAVTLYTIFITLLSIGAILAVATFVSAPWVSQAFSESRVTSVMRLVALQFLIFPFGAISDAQLRVQLRFRELGIINLSGAVISAVTVVVLALLGAGPYSLVLGMLASAAFRVAVSNWYAPMPLFLPVRPARLKGLLGFSGTVIADRSIWYWYSQADSALAARLLGAQAAGIFTLAKTTIEAPLDRLVEVLNVVSFPTYAAIQQNLKAVGEGYLKSLRMGAYLVFPLFWGLGSVAETMIPIVFGSKWNEAIIPLQILSIAIPLRALHATSMPLVTAIGRPLVSLKLTACASVIILPLMYLGIRSYGLVGAAAAWAIGYPVIFAISITMITRSLQVKSRMAWSLLARPAGCALAMALAVRFLSLTLLAHLAPGTQLTAEILVGAVFYTLAFWIVDRPTFQQLMGLLRGLMKGQQPSAADSQT